jgi:uncharacterized integral membrane protein (TIGR00698 family)
MIFYPMLVGALHLGHAAAGIFLGGTIHDVAQVEGAGYTISAQTGDIATYVKLLRVSMLLPVVFIIAVFVRGPKEAGKAQMPVPLFLLGFVALVVAGSVGLLPKMGIDAAGFVSRWCLITGVAALGVKTSFSALVKAGWRPALLMLFETAWIGGLVLLSVMFWRQ